MKRESALNWIKHNIPETIAGIALTSSVLVTTANVILRYILNHPIPGGEEIVALLFSWTVFPGAAAAYKRKMHFGIDIFVEKMSRKAKKAIDITVKLFLFILTAYITYLSSVFSISAWVRKTVMLRISYFYIDSSMVVGFGFMAFYSVIWLIDCFKQTKTNNMEAK